jgi:hypothetical protein
MLVWSMVLFYSFFFFSFLTKRWFGLVWSKACGCPVRCDLFVYITLCYIERCCVHEATKGKKNLIFYANVVRVRILCDPIEIIGTEISMRITRSKFKLNQMALSMISDSCDQISILVDFIAMWQCAMRFFTPLLLYNMN